MARLLALLLAVAATTALCASCERPPAPEQLAGWRVEAAAADVTRKESRRQAEEATWSLGVAGAVRDALTLDWPTLVSLSSTVVRTRTPHTPPYPDRAISFRGVTIGALLERAGARADVETITLLCSDAYHADLSARDAREHPIILAVEAEGRPIPRTRGGPLYAVFPVDDVPRLRPLYGHAHWGFYVSHVIAGTEARHLRVGGRGAPPVMLGPAELDALPEVKIEARPGFRLNWPHEPTTMRGRRLRDVLAAAGRPLRADDVITLRGKAPIDRDPKTPHRVHGEDALSHDVLIVERMGATGTRVPASLGGPLLLAFPDTLAGRYGPKAWVSYLEEIDVERRP